MIRTRVEESIYPVNGTGITETLPSNCVRKRAEDVLEGVRHPVKIPSLGPSPEGVPAGGYRRTWRKAMASRPQDCLPPE